MSLFVKEAGCVKASDRRDKDGVVYGVVLCLPLCFFCSEGH